jgi:osmotically inducible lipoprotein OsmB
MKTTYILLIPALLALSACGTTTQDRALGGAAVGAGAGALIGSTVGATGEGAIIGAGIGAGVGALTDSDHINLGKPWWK